MTDPADLTVCVPVYNGAGFVGETLESLRRQTYPRFRVLVSVDPSDDPSLAVCRAWEADKRFSVTGQSRRLGWIGNVNWLLERVETPLLCITLHDDWVEPDYLARLVARLDQEPSAVLTYGDIQGFGTTTVDIATPSLSGDRFERTLAFLLERTAATEWRGVIRTEAARQTKLLRADAAGFAADLLWLLELAAHGEFVREPGARYHKRYHAGSITEGWMARSPERAALEWTEHAIACFNVVMGLDGWTSEQRHRLATAAVARASVFAHAPGHPHLAPADTASLVARTAHIALRLAGLLPPGSPLPDEARLPSALQDWTDQRIGHLGHNPPPLGS